MAFLDLQSKESARLVSSRSGASVVLATALVFLLLVLVLRNIMEHIILMIVLWHYPWIGINYLRLLKFYWFYLILYRIRHQQKLTLLERLERTRALLPYRAGVDSSTLVLLNWQHLDELILVYL